MFIIDKMFFVVLSFMPYCIRLFFIIMAIGLSFWMTILLPIAVPKIGIIKYLLIWIPSVISSIFIYRTVDLCSYEGDFKYDKKYNKKKPCKEKDIDKFMKTLKGLGPR